MKAMVQRSRIADLAVRVAFSVVFAVNVECALSFVCAPDQFAGSFMLEGTGQVGEAAVVGLGITFLMWNATYPAFIVAPTRFRVLGWVILVQQLIGLVGEFCLYGSLGAELTTLRSSLVRFIVFDGAGLVLMGGVFVGFLLVHRRGDVL